MYIWFLCWFDIFLLCSCICYFLKSPTVGVHWQEIPILQLPLVWIGQLYVLQTALFHCDLMKTYPSPNVVTCLAFITNSENSFCPLDTWTSYIEFFLEYRQVLHCPYNAINTTSEKHHDQPIQTVHLHLQTTLVQHFSLHLIIAWKQTPDGLPHNRNT